MSFNSNYFKQTNNIFNLKLKPNQFTILSYLIRMANEAENCYPSMNNISEMCCVSKSTVVKTIEELEQIGYIKVNIDNTYNVYTINYDVIESTNNRPENVKKTRTKKVSSKPEVKEVKPVDSNGNAPVDGQIHFTEVKTIEERLIEETGVTEERVKQAIEYAEFKNAKDVFAYARDTIKNNWDMPKTIDEIINRTIKTTKFVEHCPAREGLEEIYNSLENKLLGWDKPETVEEETTEDNNEILKSILAKAM